MKEYNQFTWYPGETFSTFQEKKKKQILKHSGAIFKHTNVCVVFCPPPLVFTEPALFGISARPNEKQKKKKKIEASR